MLDETIKFYLEDRSTENVKDRQLRLICLALAVQNNNDDKLDEEVLESANLFFNYLKDK